MTDSYSSFGRWWHSALIATSTLTIAGCNLSDIGPSAYLPPDQYFAVLALEYHAINLSMVAPYDTVTLHTISAMGDGRVVPGEATYSVSDPAISITDGVLKANSPVTRAVVRVSLTHGTITRTDSAIVSVIANAPNRLRDFGLRVPTGDSAKISAGFIPKVLPLIRESDSGANLSTLLVHLVSFDTTIANIVLSGSNVQITPMRPGRVVLYGSTFAFGTAWRDSLVFTVGWPTKLTVPSEDRFIGGSLALIRDFVYKDVTIGVGGCVTWTNYSVERDLDVRFDDPTDVTAPVGCTVSIGFDFSLAGPLVGGNIAPFRKTYVDAPTSWEELFSVYAGRRFSVAGAFPYRSALYGTKGLVRVCDERNDTTCAPVRMGGWNQSD